MAAVALIDLTGAATIKGGFAQSPLLASGSDVNMAILNLQLIAVIIFLVAALEAQESPATESAATTEAATTEATTTEATGSPETTTGSPETTTGSPEPTTGLPETTTGLPETTTVCSSCPKNSTAPTTDPLAKEINSLENGGYPFVKPGNHSSGIRQVKAHDGFHSLRSEKQWAHWNDAFTTTPKL